MGATLHLQKLSVGTDSVEQLAEWQAMRRGQMSDGLNRHVTRMWPKRADEILGGGSIYWVIKGLVQCRQRILRFDEVDHGDGIRRCAIVLDPEVVRVTPTTRRPFQGWRYLKAADAPRDLPAGKGTDDELPPDLSAALAEIGVL